MSPAQRIEQTAAEWITRREAGAWSADDQAALDAWLDAATEHKLAFWRLEDSWDSVGRLASLKPAAEPVRRRAAVPWRPVALAASIATAAALGAGLFLTQPQLRAQRFETVVGGKETVPLADGSRVELSTDTRMRTAVGAGRREVWLDHGEAYFEVTHDATRPFVVWAGERKITVLGTRFSVRRDPDRVRVAVVEGKVRVDPLKPAAPVRPEILVRGDIVVAQGDSTLVTERSPEKVSGELSWRRGMLTFDQQTLGEVVAEFNRYNTTKLVVTDPAAARVRIGGSFEAERAERFALLLQSAYGLKITRSKDQIEISG